MCSRAGERTVPIMSMPHWPPHLTVGRAALVLGGVIVTLLGLLWFLQGAGAVHVRPILCVSHCKPITKSFAWLIIGAITCVVGIAIASAGVRRTNRDRRS
jgi:hypothetical protein